MGSVLLLFLSSAALILIFSAIGVGVIWWALFGDKARKRRCPRCWHDLSATPALTCGECGFTAQREAQLHRTRRRYGLATVSLLAILSVAAWARLEILNASWITHVPNFVVVRLPGMLPKDSVPQWVWEEITDRAAQDFFSSEDLLALIEALDSGTSHSGTSHSDTSHSDSSLGDPRQPETRALVFALQSTPHELLPDALLSPAASAARLRDRATFETTRNLRAQLIKPWIEIIPPVAWPQGAAPAAQVRGTAWGLDAEWRIRIESPRVQNAAPAESWLIGDGMSANRSMPASAALLLPLPDEVNRVQCQVLWETRNRNQSSAQWNPWVLAGIIPIDAVIAKLEATPIEPLTDDATNRAVRAAFDFPVTLWTDALRPAGIRFNTRTFAGPEYAETLLGVVVELCEDGVARRRSRLWWSGGTTERTGWEVEYEDVPALERLRRSTESAPPNNERQERAREVPGWTMRITGDLLTALRAASSLQLRKLQLPRDRSEPNPSSPDARPPARGWVGRQEWPLQATDTREAAPRRSFRSEPVVPEPPAP